tara:strand:+ start:115 stop:381 length:267 start_codon:yes stop_codon:yes gene_type:complete
MTTRFWKSAYVKNEVLPAVKAAGYDVTRPWPIEVLDPETREIHMRIMENPWSPSDGGKNGRWVVMYDEKLLDENAPREYPTGLRRPRS